MASEPIDLDVYPEARQATFSLPAKGRYTVRAPESFPAEAFRATAAGALSAQIDPTIVGPSHEGFTIRFTRVSAKTFTRGKGDSAKPASQLGDYLKACGQSGKIPGTPQDQADAVERTANSTYEVELDWYARNSNTGFMVKGMENFPPDGNGGYQSWVTDPNETDEKGQPKRLRANLEVTRFIAAGS